jgi:hypothetical protein
VWITNLSTTASVNFQFQFLRTGQANTSPASFSDTLAPGQTKIYENIVESRFGLTGVNGAGRIVASGEVHVSSRIYEQPPGTDLGSSKGLFFSGVPASFGLGVGDRASLQGVSQGGEQNLRYNFILLEIGGQPTTVHVDLKDANGATLGGKDYALQAYEHRQLNVADVLASVSTTNARLESAVASGAGKILFAGAQVTNVSQDPTGFEMSFKGSLLGGNGSAGVLSLNGLMGNVTLAGGDDVVFATSGNALATGINATASNTANRIVRRDGAGDISVGTVTLAGNLVLPVSSSTAGSLLQSGSRLLHSFGTNNVFLGRSAGNFTMLGSGNTAIGFFALLKNTSGDLNTALGIQALRENTSGRNNTAAGTEALLFNTIGANNTATGPNSLRHNISGDSNTATGFNALFFNEAGSENTAIGHNALQGNVTGFNNTAIGAAALISNTGSNNIAVGVNACGVPTAGNQNICIGHTGVAGDSQTIRIGSGSHRRTFLAGVRGMNTTTADGTAVLIDSTGQLGTVSSSASVKREIADVGGASSRLLKLRPVSFFYRNDTIGIRQYGLIAEEVAEVMPELVQFSPEGKAETVRYHFLATLLLNELQAQDRTIGVQRDEIADLKVRLRRMEEQIESVSASVVADPTRNRSPVN